jgi:hypothetical protein
MELPPISFDEKQVTATPFELDTYGSFLPYVFPRDRRDELNNKLAGEEFLIKSIITDKGLKDATEQTIEALYPITETYRRYLGILKVPDLINRLHNELSYGNWNKLVIYCSHRDVMDGLRVGLREECKPVTHYLNQSDRLKKRNVKKFQDNPRCRLFICHFSAIDTYLDLNIADRVMFAETSWRIKENVQGILRCYRIGKKTPLRVRFIGLNNSIDNDITMYLKPRIIKKVLNYHGHDLEDLPPIDLSQRSDLAGLVETLYTLQKTKGLKACHRVLIRFNATRVSEVNPKDYAQLISLCKKVVGS